MLSTQNISPPSHGEGNNQQGMFHGEKYLKGNPCAKSDCLTNCEDVTPTQIILVPHDNNVNVDDLVNDCNDPEVIINKPLQNELIQDDMTTQITNFKDKQPFEDKPTKNGVLEDIPIKIKENGGFLLNNMHGKKSFDDIVDQFKRALQLPISVKKDIQNVPNENVITTDKADESKSVDVDYNNATQDNDDQGEKSNDSLVIVSSNTYDEVEADESKFIDFGYNNATQDVKGQGEKSNDGLVVSSNRDDDVKADESNSIDVGYNKAKQDVKRQGEKSNDGLVVSSNTDEEVEADESNSIDVGYNNATQDVKGQGEKSNDGLVVSSNRDDDVKADESNSIDVGYNNATQDVKGQGEKSNDGLVVSSNRDDDVKADESNSVDVGYNNATQDVKGQGEKSNDGLVVSSNTDDKVEADKSNSIDVGYNNATQDVKGQEVKSNDSLVVSSNTDDEVKTDETKSIHVGYNNATQDVNGQGEKSNDSLVISSNTYDEVEADESNTIHVGYNNATQDVNGQGEKSNDSLVVSSNTYDEVEADESNTIDVGYNNATLNNESQEVKSNDSLVVSSNTDYEVVQCPVNGNVINNIKDNEMKDCGRDLLSQEQIEVLNESANVAKLTNVSDSSDEELSPKRSRQFTFSDSDLPDDDEIKEILMLYPRPEFIESFSESESENSSEDESNRPICLRRRNRPEPVDFRKILDKLPERVTTRLPKQPGWLGIVNIKNNSTVLKPTYLTKQEDQIDGDIITENIKRLKACGKRNTNKASKTQKRVNEEKKERSLRMKTVNKSNKHKRNVKVKPKRKNARSKSKSNARKSAKLKIKNAKDSLVAISAAKITSMRTRSMKNDNDCNKTQIKRILLRTRNKRTGISILKNSINEQSTVCNTITKITRSMKNENDGKNSQNKRVILRNKNNKTDLEQKPTNMKLRSRLIEYKERRSKRQQKTKQKNNDTMKAPISIRKKSIPEQITDGNISSSGSKSPKGLKRSLVDNSDVPSPKRTRSRNVNNNEELNSNNIRVKKTQHGQLTAFQSKELQQDKRVPYVYLERYEPAQKQIRMLTSNRNSLKMKTCGQSARRRSQRCC